ncbi:MULTISPECIES: 4a-hydroxytetrahydrobiopterin dehydratase [Candidatus Nitrosocaldus]|jgi:pterin-4a-carbinolamine dehydratase|nr:MULTISPECIES: 4a-hydroxytetrahydrobiopterin dehydratase [Candidatus Nitrosocaldus]GBC74675.1 Putative pterin-4-alpha-carbinolamine dehydratase [archaeon HR05]
MVMEDIAKAIEVLKSKGWEYVDGRLSKQYILGSFIEAIEFVNDVAAVAESKKGRRFMSRQDSTNLTIVIEDKSVELILACDDVSMMMARAVDELYEMNYASERDEDELLKREEDRERARFRSRGPYRKSSSAGLR